MRKAIVLALAIGPLALGHGNTAAQGRLSASGNARGVNNAIVGRVTDDSGNPVPGTFVTLLRTSVSRLDGASRIGPVSAILGSVADERGEFRLENLAPGSYYPVAAPQNLRPGSNIQVSRAGYAVTYYPSRTNLADAQPVEVAASATVTANITLVSAPLFVVSGSVVAPGGQPWRDERLGVAHGDALFGLDSKALSIQPDGRFRVPNLARGSYCLQMRVGAWPPPRDTIPLVFGARVMVVDRDLANVRVTPINMVKASGRLLVDPATRATLRPPTINVGAAPAESACNPGPQRPGVVGDDLTFEFRTWPGRGYVSMFRQALGDVPATIRLNGVDVTTTGIDFREGADVSGIEIDVRRPARSR